MPPSKLSSRKAKGKAFERYIRDRIRDFTGLGDGDIESAVGAETGIDIKLSAEARARFSFSAECKARRDFDPAAWVRQAAGNVYPGTIPIAVVKPDRRPPEDALVVIRFDDFLGLLREKSQ